MASAMTVLILLVGLLVFAELAAIAVLCVRIAMQGPPPPPPRLTMLDDGMYSRANHFEPLRKPSA
jgi:hypothetical protein